MVSPVQIFFKIPKCDSLGM